MFSCQRCKQPIRIDESLVDLNNTSIDLLLAPLPEDDVFPSTTSVLNSSGKSLTNNLQQISHAFESNNNSLAKRSNTTTHNYGLSRSPTINNKESFLGPSESYVMLSRSQVAPPLNSSNELSIDVNVDDRQRASLSYRLKLARRLFDLMSSRSEIDHPICQECTDMLLESLNKQLSDASKERDCYIDFLKKVNSNVISDAKQEDLRQEIQEIQARESSAITTLKEIERERDNMKRELAELEQEANELDKLEESYWKEFNDFHIQLQIFQNERDSVNVKYDHDAKQLEKLQKTNVYNDTFCISHDGSFGTINGFRLGRLQNQPVEWSEINAAWGQAVSSCSFRSIDYYLNIDLEILNYRYGSGDIGIGRIFQNNRFDNAMVAFLNCLQQLGDYAERQDHNLKLPYRINKDRIGDVSIKRQFNQDDNWTRALKYTLTNTKWILAYASSSNHDWSKQRSNFLTTR
ncbi:6225_t:CDS:2 [Ambispora gerdemannii]|uniref:6225_t:CDS:1 n=1 Tax=Ambispora gerdemannii TaxID=144530 RepID=A0A9N9BXX3_9GLOM|nr:6225_t:CDS:2 [Ambispora gerdemannii]